jgi:hypothetical protein
MSGDRIEAVIAEGVDRIAIPPESEWLPDPSRARRRRVRPARLVFVPLVAAVIVLAAVIGYGLRAVRESPATQPPATSSPESHPGPSYPLSGRVVRLVPGGVVVDSAGRQIEVSFSAMVDVWKETSVPASALEVGDDLFIDGGHVYANIGRIDGVIREIDATGMLVDVQLRPAGSVLQRIDFSPYIEYGTADGSVQLTREDLVVGRVIGAVIYGRLGGPLRATRIW